jgi:non-ribosomal peptide synthetase component F
MEAELAANNHCPKMEEIRKLLPHNPRKEDIQKMWVWNKTLPTAIQRCLHDLISEVVEAQSSASAICAWDGNMSYGELEESSNRLANYLVGIGVGPEVIVPLCFEKSMWAVVAMLAVLKAGGVFSPLDPEHPRSRHDEIFRQTRAKLVLTSAQYAAPLGNSGRTVIAVSETWIRQLPSTVNSSWSMVQPENAAYVIFTSGSTGVPKGVIMEH